MKAFVKERKYELMLALCLLALCAVPLLFGKVYTGHDFAYHFGRIRCLADNIQNGKWFEPVYYSGLYDAGYASPAFYGDVFLYIPALAVCAGMAEELAFRLFIMLVTAAAACSAFWCAAKGFQNKQAAFVCAFCFVFSSYYAVDAYTRTALGEMLSFVFLPLAALGFYSIMFGDGRYKLCLPWGLAFLLLSHVLSAAISVFVMALFALVYIKRLVKEKQRFFMLVTSAALFFGVTAFFICPLAEQLGTGGFVATNGMSAVRWGTLESRSLPWYATIYDFCMGSATGAWIPNGLGLFPVVTLIFCGIVSYKNKRVARFAAVTAAYGAVTLFLTTSLFPWRYFQSVFGGIQFPWRLLEFATGFFALLAGYTASQLRAASGTAEKNSKKGVKKAQPGRTSATLYVFMALVIGFSAFSYINTSAGAYGNMLKKAASGEEVTPSRTMIGAGEYLRITEDTYAVDAEGRRSTDAELVTGIKSVLSQNSKKVISNNISKSNLKLERGYGELSVEFSGNTADGTYITVPLINYKGYSAYVNGAPAEISDGVLEANVKLNGTEYTVRYGAAVRVDIGGAESGVVTVRYEGTGLQLISKLITLFTLIGAAAYGITKKVRSRSQIQSRAQ